MDHLSTPGPHWLRSSGAQAGATSLTLIEKAKAHHGEAWRRLVDLYTPLLRQWCSRWGVQGADADDVIQDVFQGVFVSLQNFGRDHESASFRAWLHGVARYKMLSLLRRRNARGPGGTDFYEKTLLLPDPAMDDHDHEEGRLIGATYREALGLVRAEFEDRTWQAFWRATVEGQPCAVIAKEMDVTPAAVRQAKSRVLRRLKEVLGYAPQI
ncbi:RNA polymerase sigma factor [Singulisphaera sp. PoT]|uniref:RNA polymerase sigma factor n=1 Tax=Singulisphaera sp. PoT TaxID=3411797 RepID=UPI003BF4E0B2